MFYKSNFQYKILFISFLCGFFYLKNGSLIFGQDPQAIISHPVFLKFSNEVMESQFIVEVADEPIERQIGLMFRTTLPNDTGMLFDFHEQRMISMWMKNTPLSLDMIFIDKNGIVEHIAYNTEPYSLDIISSNKPVRYVLEINAGLASKYNINVGDHAHHPIISK